MKAVGDESIVETQSPCETTARGQLNALNRKSQGRFAFHHPSIQRSRCGFALT